MTQPPAIVVRKLNVWYDSLHALKNLDIELPARQIVALIGASGSGKSTFLRSINRMLDTIPMTRVEGEILVDGRNVVGDDCDVIGLRRKVGMVFQNPTPFPKSIYQNVSYGLEIGGMRRPRRGWFGLPVAAPPRDIETSDHPMDRAVVRSLKEASLWDEVKDRLKRSAYRLSGGQQQRLCIARAIAVRPDILLLDEPCSQLDPISTRLIEDLLLRLKNDYTIIIVTHNMHQARRVSDFTGFFHAGSLIEFGPTKEIFGSAKEALTRQYVGGEFG
jgi:phosphate transport system ATP-binding protein